MFPRDIVFLRNISIKTLLKGDDDDDDDDDDDNNNNNVGNNNFGGKYWTIFDPKFSEPPCDPDY